MMLVEFILSVAAKRFKVYGSSSWDKIDIKRAAEIWSYSKPFDYV
ncbi:hypothetical protein [Halobacillus amylolyticus]|nr:hypothetical protein [Halobacillus amylolyticus]